MSYTRIKKASPRPFEAGSTTASKEKRAALAPFDKLLFCLILLLAAFGSVMIFSASYANAGSRYGDSYYFIKRQVLWLFVGVVVMLLLSRPSVGTYKKITPYAYAVTLALLLAVLIVGQSGGGAQRWLGIGALTFQPSELAKATLVFILARHYEKRQDTVLDTRHGGRSFRDGTLLPLGYIALTCGLVALERHLSCTIILGLIGILMMTVGGSRLRYLGIFGAVGAAGVTAMALFTDYTKRRLLIWQNPAAYPLDGGWQTLQGMMAIGSGGLFGRGLGGSLLKYSYVSEPQNDFIFTIACEELGFFGALFILLLFALFLWRAAVIAMRHPDSFCKMCIFGIAGKVAVQVLLNVAVVTNAIPNTGISLPFFSYGGSSLVMLFAEMGVLLSFSRTAHLRG